MLKIIYASFFLFRFFLLLTYQEMVQRNNNNESVITFIIQWIHNHPPPSSQEYNTEENKTNPRQQLMFARNLKRSRHRAWRTLPDFNQLEQQDFSVIDNNLS
jgi:hypothetical protein